MEKIKTAEGTTYKDQCTLLDIPYSSFMRWRANIKAGREARGVPGPRKVEPLDVKGLEEQVKELKHGHKRTAGTGELYEKYSSQISRRAFNLIIKRARKDRNAEYAHIIWHRPGMIWGMDDARYRSFVTGELFYLHAVQDMCSRYKFRPLVDLRLASGPMVARNLELLFKEHGRPLFLKRDYGSNLNHHDVDELCARLGVIPLNSPPHYPQYNGGVERAQRELKSWINGREPSDVRDARVHAELAANELNHKNRRVLGNKTSCMVLQQARGTHYYNKRKRKEIYDWIKETSLCIMENENGQLPMHAAWRVATEIWLRKHGFVTVTNRKKCYPIFH